MTTIVYKNGVLAADRQVNYKGKIFGETKKVCENDKFIWASCGSSTACNEFGKFLNGKEFKKEIFEDDNHNNFDAIVINKETHKVQIYDCDLIADEIIADSFCFGSGADIAKGALEMGADPVRAIEIAAKFDHATSSKVDAIFISPERTSENSEN